MKIMNLLLSISLFTATSAYAADDKFLTCETSQQDKVNVSALDLGQKTVLRVTSAYSSTRGMIGQIEVSQEVAREFSSGNFAVLLNQQINGAIEGQLLITKVGESFSGQEILQIKMRTDSNPNFADIRSIDLSLFNCLARQLSGAGL